MTAGIPDSAGVPAGCTQDTLSAIYNDLASVEALFAEYPKEIAAVIVEPVAANMGVVPPKKGFLEGLRKFCSEHGSVLIFDEVITGFRLGLQGAQGYFGIDADLVTYGKIIGAGMPVGAYGGKREIMEMVSPVGAVYQAGTLSGNPVAMAAGIAQLTILKNNPQIYEELNQKSDTFFETMKENAAAEGDVAAAGAAWGFSGESTTVEEFAMEIGNQYAWSFSAMEKEVGNSDKLVDLMLPNTKMVQEFQGRER